MAHYLVVWTIDIEADSPKEAAEKAREIQRKHDSIAIVFDVQDTATQEFTQIDLDCESGEG